MDMTQNALLMKISECEFVCVELNLYLNTHPDDEEARADYYTYSVKLRNLIEDYEEAYGPLKNFGHSPTMTGCWARSKWPWEV